MKCPECGAWTIVKETRETIFRVRECANLHKFRTEEIVLGPLRTRSRKKDLSETKHPGSKPSGKN